MSHQDRLIEIVAATPWLMSPVRATACVFRARAEAKRYCERWPRVRILWE